MFLKRTFEQIDLNYKLRRCCFLAVIDMRRYLFCCCALGNLLKRYLYVPVNCSLYTKSKGEESAEEENKKQKCAGGSEKA